MSCLPLSMTTLASVRETLRCSYSWTEDAPETPIALWFAFTDGRSVRSDLVATRHSEKFVELAYIFNCIEYSQGEEARTNSEPVSWGLALDIAKHGQGQRLSILQLIKSLECIDYNTSSDGWLEKEEYENWARREEFEKFKTQLKRIILALLSSVVSRLPEYKQAKWG